MYPYWMAWASTGEGFWLLMMYKFDVSSRRIPVSLIYNAITMDEKCEMIKLRAGVLVSDPKQYPILDLPE